MEKNRDSDKKDEVPKQFELTRKKIKAIELKALKRLRSRGKPNDAA